MKKLLKLIEAYFRSWVEGQNSAADAARAAEATAAPKLGIQAPLGLASCWDGSNAAKRMMNILSPRMSDAKVGEYIAWMKARGCTAAHVILANGADGECAGYAAWRDADRTKMLKRMEQIRAAGLVPVPWVITDDSSALLKELFGNPEKLVGNMRDFFAGAPFVVLGLEMDETGSEAQWKTVRAAVKNRFSGPLGVHHTSGNSFKYAELGDIVLGQLNPGCSEADVKKQIQAIRAKGKRAVGFEYARGANRKLAEAALAAGAEGVGNW